jgi:Ser/Thr protein kinase RdoA (MazF antagonist)
VADLGTATGQGQDAAMPAAVLRELADRFALGTIDACTAISQGLMNLNWRVRSGAGEFAIKQIRDATPAAARRQHRLLPRLAERGIPVPAVRHTRDGDSLAEIDGHRYAALGWSPGRHRTGLQLSLPACGRLGGLLGSLHRCLQDLLPATPLTLPGAPVHLHHAVAQLDMFASAAAGHDDFDRLARAEIAWRRRLLDEIACLRPPDRPVRPVGWTHGDLNHLNLLFTGDAVSAVLDWDRLGVRPYGLEVVRTATLLFATGDERGADLHRIAAFTAGYRNHIAISDDELRDAALRRWWAVACESWILRLHYLGNNRSCDHLLPASGLMLRWWTRHRDAVDAALSAC